MSSLLPFDFRCIGHLIGVSLRCAPLQVRLPSPRRRRHHHHHHHPVGPPTVGADDDTDGTLGDAAPSTTEAVSVSRHSSSVRSSRRAPTPSRSPVTSSPPPPPPPPPTQHTVSLEASAPTRLLSFHFPRLCLEMYYTASVAPRRVVASPPTTVYTSEVARGSSHPCWRAIPASQLRECSAALEAELAFHYTAACVGEAVQWMARTSGVEAAAPAADLCVYRCRVDMRDVVYAGPTVEEADATLSRLLLLEEQQTQTSSPRSRHGTRPIVFLRCVDGVFVPRLCLAWISSAATALLEEMRVARTRSFAPPPTTADLQAVCVSPAALHTIGGRTSIAATAATQAVAACEEVPWSRAASSVGWLYPPTAVPRTGLLRTSVDEVKAAALTTLAWQRLATAEETRLATLAATVNAAEATHAAERAQEVRCAALRVQLSAAREQLTLTTLELESLREQVEQRQRRLQQEEEAHATLQRYALHAASAEAQAQSREAAREEEAQRARLRAQLARSRQQRARELSLVYRVELSAHYASPACARAADAKDHINKCALPILVAGGTDADAASSLVASSAEDMHDEAIALGHAGHILVVLSTLYSCALPHPVLLGSGQSHVLVSPNMSPAQALASPGTVAEAHRYPLFCSRATERPLMMAGVHLLLRDGAALATAMGKSERRVLAASDRLGALLDLLLDSTG
ncbi:hypothetical protein NESM_000727600 [Novymonas esmeraldas]|uniref:Uncharacterized protein n=1 Tax=Novymonas esmeraldas TaxID=1808958 RepID=A0AAW0EW43_9TRYP